VAKEGKRGEIKKKRDGNFFNLLENNRGEDIETEIKRKKFLFVGSFFFEINSTTKTCVFFVEYI